MNTGKKEEVTQNIDYLLKRGVAEVIVAEEMRELLRSGKKLRLKEGFDPSFPDIHLGHIVALRKLRQFQELGIRLSSSLVIGRLRLVTRVAPLSPVRCYRRSRLRLMPKLICSSFLK